MGQVTPPQTKRAGSGIQRFAARSYPKVHIFLYRLTNGSLGGKFGERAFLLLTTTGRKSGREQTTPLFYFPDGERFIVIASNGGAATHPQWWLNLRVRPEAKVQLGQRNIAVTARQAEGAERQQLWSTITAKFSNFLDYQKKTTREIPVVILTPDE